MSTEFLKREFEELLRNHDWYYQYANGETYSKGQAQRDKINRLMAEKPDLQALYNEYVKKHKIKY